MSVTTAAALDFLGTLLVQAIKVSSMIKTAQAEGRDSLTDAELDELAGGDDAARANLVEAIERAKAEGR